jgi:hypothetical protein
VLTHGKEAGWSGAHKEKIQNKPIAGTRKKEKKRNTASLYMGGTLQLVTFQFIFISISVKSITRWAN